MVVVVVVLLEHCQFLPRSLGVHIRWHFASTSCVPSAHHMMMVMMIELRSILQTGGPPSPKQDYETDRAGGSGLDNLDTKQHCQSVVYN